MKGKTLLAMVLGLSALALAATCGSALAFGHHGHHRGDMKLYMLAHAAGISGQTIHSTFKSDAVLKSDFQAVMTAKKAMDTCIIAGNCTTGSTGQVATYANAVQALTLQKMTDWQTIFTSAGANNAAAVSLKGQLDQLNAQKHQIMHQAFGSAAGTSGTPQLTPQ